MEYTEHLNLKKPTYAEFGDVEDLNDNFDTIDEAIKAIIDDIGNIDSLETEQKTNIVQALNGLNTKVATHLAEKATTEQYGHVKLSSSITSNSEEFAATPKSVKALKDFLASFGFSETSGTLNEVDLNTAPNGMYYVNLVTNAPTGLTHGYLICISLSSSLKFQLFVNGMSTSVHNTKIFKRNFYSNAWSPWVSLIDSSDIISGSGSPEGMVAAPVGTLYKNLSGGDSTTLYIKTSGTGNTGWTAK